MAYDQLEYKYSNSQKERVNANDGYNSKENDFNHPSDGDSVYGCSFS